MGKAKIWILAQWNDVKGSVKFWVISVLLGSGAVSSMVTSLVRHIQIARGAAQQDRLGYIILGILIFCALVLCALFTALSRRFVSANSNTLPNQINLPRDEQLKEPFPPKPVDIAGQIIDIYFRGLADGWGTYQTLVNFRATNRGPQKATVTEFKLFIVAGEEQLEGTCIPFPPNLYLQKKSPGMFDDTLINTPLVPAINTDHVYDTGIPHAGWMVFGVFSFGSTSYPYNARLLIKMMDSFGGEHWIDRPPQLYRAEGNIVEIEPPKMAHLGLLKPQQ